MAPARIAMTKQSVNRTDDRMLQAAVKWRDSRFAAGAD